MDISAIIAKMAAEDQEPVRSHIASLESQATIARQQADKDKAEKNRLLHKHKSVDSVLSELGVDLESEDAIESIRQFARQKPGQPDTTGLKKLEQQIAALTAERDEERKRREKIGHARLMEGVKNALKNKIYNEDSEAYRLVHTGKVAYGDDYETPVWKDGDEQKDFQTGLEEYIKTRADILINSQLPGGGSKPASGQQAKKQLTETDFKKLSPKERAAFVNSGGAIT